MTHDGKTLLSASPNRRAMLRSGAMAVGLLRRDRSTPSLPQTQQRFIRTSTRESETPRRLPLIEWAHRSRAWAG